ncbi:hypothetical protein PsorP6_015760 [Peronosclerospora sorghi]|uniref:Uncharacterized protein n=1 Tax=Peronosclerospora sorghi TaxID=230839 RepID=A0ACC0WN52_9STRA|nr:hypothetical protein PsorP6_015760 [Peronosclerospora sorghi]
MLPQRRTPPSFPHRRSRGNARQFIYVTLGLLFFLYLYLNVRFFTSSWTSTESSSGLLHSPPRQEGNKTLSATSVPGQVKHLVFTSTCRDQDFIHAEVLSFTLRRTGYDGNLTHLLYGCTSDEALRLMGKKDPRHDVQTRHYPDISASTTTFGEKLLTTTVNVLVLAKWMLGADAGALSGKQTIPFTERYALAQDDYVMVVDSDAIFTKRLEMANLLTEVNAAIGPRIFGQDASWYWPKRFPLTTDQLRSLLPRYSPALLLQDWREYAAIAPFIAQVSAWQEVLPTAVDVWKKLALKDLYLALPIAAAHVEIPIGISGVLSVHHFTSRYQNWDFADDITHNPCREHPQDEIRGLSSYPISLRALNFTLPQWIDGRDWNFYATQIPSDFFACDAWMLHQPTGHLWYLANHTSGYEHVPNILRRRFTISLCLAIEAYNSASEHYRSRACPHGYNHNHRLVTTHSRNTDARGSAVPHARDTLMENDPPVYFGDVKSKEDAPKKDLQPGQEGNDDIHFVFFTSCELSDHWQSQVLAQTFARVNQHGALTRIVSGCSEKEMKALISRTHQSSPHLRLHMTRDFRSPNDSHWSSTKPFALRDWLQFANPPVNEHVLVLLDRDFVFLRPFAVNTGGRVTIARGVDSHRYAQDAEVIEGMRQYKRFFVYSGSRQGVSDTVTDGMAVAHRRAGYVDTGAFANSSALCPECPNVTTEEATEYYAGGLPYVMTRKDLMAMVDDYCNITVLYREGKDEMSERLGYALAAAKHGVKHTTFDNLALSNTADDYTGFLELMQGNPCQDPVLPMIPGEAPPLLHGNHPFEALDDRGLSWIFFREWIPTNLFACDTWLLAPPPASVWTLAKQRRDRQRMVEAFGVCTSIKVWNQVLVDFKSKMCPNGFNQNRRLRLVKNVPQHVLNVGSIDVSWLNAAEEME